MTKRALTILAIGIVLVGGAAAVIASSIGGGDNASATHTMPNGQTMTGQGMTHTMSNGQTMSGSGMNMDK